MEKNIQLQELIEKHAWPTAITLCLKCDRKRCYSDHRCFRCLKRKIAVRRFGRSRDSQLPGTAFD